MSTIVRFPSGGPLAKRGQRRRKGATPAGNVIEIVWLDQALSENVNPLLRRTVRISRPRFIAPHGAYGTAKLISELLLRQSLNFTPLRQFHYETAPLPSPLPIWLYRSLALWQYANMAKCQIVYIRPVANDDEAPNRIQELIDAAGISQADLARMANVTVSALNKVIKGTRGLDQDWMRRLAPHLNVSPAELLPKTDNPDILSVEERELIERIRSSDRQMRQTFSRVVDAVLPNPNVSRADVA